MADQLLAIYSRMDELVAEQPCAYCGAAPGNGCVRRRTRVPCPTHAKREAPIWEAYRLGMARQRLTSG